LARAIHRLDGEHPLVAAFGDEHILPEFLRMPGGFPQAAVQKQRPAYFLIAGRATPAAHVRFDCPVEGPPLRVPENAAARPLTQMEEVELAAEPAVVAALRLFELKEVLIELFLAPKRGAVDALQLGVFRVTTPIGAGEVHQLEGLAEV